MLTKQCTCTIREAVNAIFICLREAKHKAFLVGGCVRDAQLNREPKDYDICTNATPDEIRAALDVLVKKDLAKVIDIRGAQFGVLVVVIGGHSIEVATFRSDGAYTDGRRPVDVVYSKNLRDDVERRDFTINGMACVSFDNHTAIDFVNGMRDIRAKEIRCIGNPHLRFQEDALRMLRAIRLACQLGFAIEEDTYVAIGIAAPQIEKVSYERIRDEIIKMLESPDPARAFYMLNQTGLLGFLIPKMADTKFAWTLRKLDFGCRRKFNALTMIALLGSELDAIDYLSMVKLLRLSNFEEEQLLNGRVNRNVLLTQREFSRAERIRFMRTPGAHISLNLFEVEAELKHIVSLGRLSNLLAEFKNVDVPDVLFPNMLISGADLIALGLTPGYIFKDLLDQIETMQLDGVISLKEAALVKVQEILDCYKIGKE